MSVTVQGIIDYIEQLAPPAMAYTGDPIGLQLGNHEAVIDKVLVSLDPDLAAVDEAIDGGAGLLVTHHPLFFHKPEAIDEQTALGKLVSRAIRAHLSIYSAHTNYDLAPHGVNYQLALRLGLPVENASSLKREAGEQYLKLVVYVPFGYEDMLRNRLAEAGAGQIGRYSHCTFQTPGVGTFRPEIGTSPFSGRPGQLKKVEESRLETILPAANRAAVLQAVLEAHPYEEVAYDLYRLEIEGPDQGLGLLIGMDQALSPQQLIETCREKLGATTLRYWLPDGCNNLKTIALCGGSGGSLIEEAARKKAELYITGDLGYHDLQRAQALGLALIDAGHDHTEQPGIEYLAQYLQTCLQQDQFKARVSLGGKGLTGWR